MVINLNIAVSECYLIHEEQRADLKKNNIKILRNGWTREVSEDISHSSQKL